MSKPFHRASLMSVAIAAFIAQFGTTAGMPDNVSNYKSRGKGRGTPARNFMRGSSSKYMPHQGKKEIARRATRGW